MSAGFYLALHHLLSVWQPRTRHLASSVNAFEGTTSSHVVGQGRTLLLPERRYSIANRTAFTSQCVNRDIAGFRQRLSHLSSREKWMTSYPNNTKQPPVCFQIAFQNPRFAAMWESVRAASSHTATFPHRRSLNAEPRPAALCTCRLVRPYALRRNDALRRAYGTRTKESPPQACPLGRDT